MADPSPDSIHHLQRSATQPKGPEGSCARGESPRHTDSSGFDSDAGRAARRHMGGDGHRRSSPIFQVGPRVFARSCHERQFVDVRRRRKGDCPLNNAQRCSILHSQAGPGFVSLTTVLAEGYLPSLQSGVRLGPYEILSALGAGGMGEVYKARDAKLDRDVAIILSEPFQSAHDRRRWTRAWPPGLAPARTTCSPLVVRAAIPLGDHRRRAEAAARGPAS